MLFIPKQLVNICVKDSINNFVSLSLISISSMTFGALLIAFQNGFPFWV